MNVIRHGVRMNAASKGTPANIAAEMAALHGQGARRNLPPVLALGTFERVGSNWLSDSLRSVMPQHNEPFRQQLGAQHPLSPLNPEPAAGLDSLGRHHLACALSDLYGRPRHVVKETNLFFAAEAVTALLPDSPILVLSRAPLGIASSFVRGDLWVRWRYERRYEQLATVARRTDGWRHFAPLLPHDGPEPSVALARMIAVNALLLAQALTSDLAGCGRPIAHLAYERHVTDPHDVLDGLARYLATSLPVGAPTRPSGTGAPGILVDATFATNSPKQDLVAEVESRTAALVPHHVAETLARAGQVVDASVTATASHWLAGDELYQVREPADRRRPARLPQIALRLPAVGYRTVAMAQVTWRNLLVSNQEMADLLNALQEAGLSNTRSGVHLLVCPMPHERGGRLHLDTSRRRWRVSPGYEQHPAYWVTWLGAAAMAAWSGARLPTRAEALQAVADAPPVFNCNYAVGDVSPVAEPGRGPGHVHHLVGNVQIWCGDGPVGREEEPLRRYLFGAAWNTPADRESIKAARSRYLLGSSRGVGVRLVRDPRSRVADELGAWELTVRINRWIEALDGPVRLLGELDRLLVTALAGPGPAVSGS